MPSASAVATDATPERVSPRLLTETVGLFVLAIVATAAVLRYDPPGKYVLLALLVVFQGLWLDRMYIAAHEAIHKKLFPESPRWNDAWGTLLLLPVAAPFTVYRKIHYFHHGHNRRDHSTANLDTFVTRAEPTALRRAWYHAVWLWLVFGGGFFVHSLVSVLLFLVAPVGWAERLSPVFKHWTPARRIRAWAELLAGIGFHAGFAFVLGPELWVWSLGLPLAFFAWVWSLLLYVYHYDTSVGPDVRHNVRSLPRNRFFSWLLLNFNEHATHHHDPSVPWFELPVRRHELPAAYGENQKVHSLWAAIRQQARGPLIENAADVGEFSVALRPGRQ